MLTDLKIPFVAHGRSDNCNQSAWIDIDNEAAFYDMTKHFVSLGHKKIAHIGGPSIYNFSIQRETGWRKCLFEACYSIPEEYLQIAELSFEGGMKAMDKLLNLNDPPTSVCCVSDTVAIGAMQSLRNNNLSPGKEVSLIGYDGLEDAYKTMGLACYGQQIIDLGEIASYSDGRFKLNMSLKGVEIIHS